MSLHNYKGRQVSDLDINDLGSPDSIRYNVLTFVVNEEYDRAIAYLRDFLEMDSKYPNFKDRIQKYVKHAIELIYAIRNKRSFPGASLLTKSKQVEIRDRFKEQFHDLKSVMKKIENCHEELRLNDIKSTTILVRALWFSITAIAIAAFLLEFVTSLGMTMLHVFDTTIGALLSYAFEAFGLI